MRTSIITASALGLAFTLAQLQAEVMEPYQVGVLTEYIEVEHDQVTELLLSSFAEEDGTPLRERMRILVEKGEARIVESSYLLTTMGRRARIESIREWIYPTEFDPPEMPQDLTGPIAPGTDIITETNPTAYEMRPVGHTVEVDPEVTGDGQWIGLNFAPEMVQFLRSNEEFGKDEAQTVQPVFYSIKCQTVLRLASGKPEMFGLFTPHEAFGGGGTGKRLLGFVTASALRPWRAEDGKTPPLTMEAEPADEEEDEENVQRGQVTLLTEYIEVDRAAAHALIGKLDHHVDATAVRRELDGPIRDGGARLLESSVLLTRLGQRAKTESILEYIYPTEYDPPELPQNLTGPIDAMVRIMTSTGATAFEMRPTGVTVEVDPNRAKGRASIDLNIAPEMVRLADMLVHGKDAAEAKQPLFESLKLQTGAALPENATLLLGMHSLESARAVQGAKPEEQTAVRDKRVLVFVTLRFRDPR